MKPLLLQRIRSRRTPFGPTEGVEWIGDVEETEEAASSAENVTIEAKTGEAAETVGPAWTAGSVPGVDLLI
jgi:hypothetical protein